MLWDTTLELGFLMSVAMALIAISTCQFISMGVASGRASSGVRQRLQTDLRGLRQAAEVARLNSELQSSSQSGGIHWRVMEVAEIIDESADCRSYYLIDPYRQSLPAFLPGQHLLVRPALSGAYQTTRCYSISSAPDERYWRITVKRQDSAQQESLETDQTHVQQRSFMHQLPKSGGLSVWLHATIGVGDCLLVGGPNGHFHVSPESARPLVLLAAGVGITPMASILRWSMQNTPSRSVRVLYQARDTQHWPLGPALHRWTRKFPECQVTSFFSRSSPEELDELSSRKEFSPTRGQPTSTEFVHGRFTAQDVLSALPNSQCDYFLCGPPAWMDAIRVGLLEAGIAEHHIHWESFGGGINQTAAPAAEPGSGLTVKFAASNVCAQWDTSDQSLWELAREHNIEIPSGCLSGVCGCCRVKLLSGSVRYDRDITLELADDECLACVARPQTDCCIDV